MPERSAPLTSPDQHLLSGKRILIANHQFIGLTGSDIHCLQLAQDFIARGAEVTFFGFRSSDAIVAEIEKLGCTFIGKWSLWRQSRRRYDIIWSHHETSFVYLHVLLGLTAHLHVHGVLSTQIALERMPLPPECKASRNLVFLANSVETRDHIHTVAGRSDVMVLRNIVPDGFFSTVKPTYSAQIKRVAIVSNHVAEEVRRAADMLRDDGIEVVIFGVGHTYQPINETTLLGFDVVITIGKTAQYCIVQGIPLYLYDHFGGPGYISTESLALHEDFNFSGRSAPRKLTAGDLVQELRSRYSSAIHDTQALQKHAAHRYSIGPQLEPVFDRMGGGRSRALDARARWSTLALYLRERKRALLRMLVPPASVLLTARRETTRGQNGLN